MIYLPANEEVLMAYPDGIAYSAGFSFGSNTTAGGSTASATADQPSGFVIVGAP
jgi:hypothetical protein